MPKGNVPLNDNTVISDVNIPKSNTIKFTQREKDILEAKKKLRNEQYSNAVGKGIMAGTQVLGAYHNSADSTTSDRNKTTVGNIIGGAMTGASLGSSIVPGVGTVVGAGLGALSTGLASQLGNINAKEREIKEAEEKNRARLRNDEIEKRNILAKSGVSFKQGGNLYNKNEVIDRINYYADKTRLANNTDFLLLDDNGLPKKNSKN